MKYTQLVGQCTLRNFVRILSGPFLMFKLAYEIRLNKTNTVQSRAVTRVTIQKIKSLGVLQFKFYVVKGGATNRDMSLTETCQCSRLYGKFEEFLRTPNVGHLAVVLIRGDCVQFLPIFVIFCRHSLYNVSQIFNVCLNSL